ncbi:LysM peptidoglycan-binding domain-containing protein [Flavobacterium sp. GSP27]|uniref:Peptidoglycan hydrolase n=1 Tax=Flavobacterium bomense TaxID=2497483 RepID=A0A432CL91_9FLAO|nr:MULTISPECIES: glucosaminidase domain-containing protein [Flavobacterium]RTY90545.1 LysM peptidoglycan-binding domain-containing protein [Flavobacterium sp. GSN2]RTY68919.1 LysM peptidoglycan-binding domain-containing protein [Flavobacterium sp. LB2P53]RTY73795.1 LysM peptidoglycan-binding domain-containing protein [Flavobacterium sp. LS1R10]RTY80556.1 LysM peptidoglycan-binding domain-containing protein [Flavobacterium sp. LS1P28]RTY83885.1 LysM peptidoglycan-binding domain-containing prote
MIKKILLLFILITLVSCNATKPIIVTTKKAPSKSKIATTAKKGYEKKTKTVRATAGKSSSKELNNSETEEIVSTSKTIVTNDVIVTYVSIFKDIAMGNMRNYGIPASIILAQAILESGAGKGNLALNANNHFGIKCHVGWTGESIRHDDDAAQECFRKYDNPSESFKDHALFLTGRSRYAGLFEFSKGDYKAWAKGLKAAGYATDPKYPDKLISYIERYNLHEYDNQVLDINYVSNEKQMITELTVESRNTIPKGLDSYVVQKGDTLYSISKKFELKIEDLKQKNNLSDNALSIGQKLVVK